MPGEFVDEDARRGAGHAVGTEADEVADRLDEGLHRVGVRFPGKGRVVELHAVAVTKLQRLAVARNRDATVTDHQAIANMRHRASSLEEQMRDARRRKRTSNRWNDRILHADLRWNFRKTKTRAMSTPWPALFVNGFGLMPRVPFRQQRVEQCREELLS